MSRSLAGRTRLFVNTKTAPSIGSVSKWLRQMAHSPSIPFLKSTGDIENIILWWGVICSILSDIFKQQHQGIEMIIIKVVNRKRKAVNSFYCNTLL